MRTAALLAAGIAGAMMAATGCSRLEVVSDPPGADVLWSANGVDNWNPWPPRAWADDSPAGAPGSPSPRASEPARTPVKSSGVYGDTVWITVEKEGYYRPLPRAAQLYALRNEKLSFSLAETPEAYAARREAEGFVRWRGEWVKPEEKGLAQFGGAWMTKADAFEREQISKGLVKYGDAWVTREQAASLHADGQRAKGLVEFKDRWVAPAAQLAEEAVDAEVDALAATDPKGLALPRVIGPVDGDISQLQILNSTSNAIRFLLSGPESREFAVGPYSSVGLSAEDRLRLVPGRYEMAVIPASGLADQEAGSAAARVAPDEANESLYVEASLASGFQYLMNYDVESDFGEGTFEDYRPTEPELPIDPPTIEIPEIELPQERPRRVPGGGRAGGGVPGMRPEGGQGGQMPAAGAGNGGQGQRPRQRDGAQQGAGTKPVEGGSAPASGSTVSN